MLTTISGKYKVFGASPYHGLSTPLLFRKVQKSHPLNSIKDADTRVPRNAIVQYYLYQIAHRPIKKNRRPNSPGGWIGHFDPLNGYRKTFALFRSLVDASG